MHNDYNMYTPGGPGGVSIKGKWTNKRTGETVTVRDNIIGDYGMSVMLADGRMVSMTQFSRDYIQASDEVYDVNGRVVEKSPYEGDFEVDKSSITTPTTYTDEEKHNLLNQTFADIKNIVSDIVDTKPQQSEQKVKVTSNNYELIDKLFSKIEHTPEIKVTVSWAKFPKQELKTLTDFLDVEKKDIADYVYNKYANAEYIKNELTQYLSTMLDGNK